MVGLGEQGRNNLARHRQVAGPKQSSTWLKQLRSLGGGHRPSSLMQPGLLALTSCKLALLQLCQQNHHRGALISELGTTAHRHRGVQGEWWSQPYNPKLSLGQF